MRPLVAIAFALVALVALGGSGATPTATAQEGGAGDRFRVLVFSRTEGFRHLSIPQGIAAIQSLGEENGFDVEATEDPVVFNDGDLDRFAAVVFLLTTGDVIPDEGEAAFERYVRRGGGYVGIHSAADTEYEWPFYGELLGGAWFKNHPIQQPGVLVNEAPDHPSTAHLSGRWVIPFEEFYSFVANPRPHVRVLLNIDESTYQQDPNTSNLPNQENWMEGETGTMGDHPMSWCHDIDDGHAWYTALGHEGYLYETPDFRQHILGGILTAARQVAADCRIRTAAVDEEPTPPPSGSAEDRRDAEAEPASQRSLPATGAPAVVPLVGLVLLVAVGLRRRGRGRTRRPSP